MALGDEQIDRLLQGLQTWSDDFLKKLESTLNRTTVTNTTVLNVTDTLPPKAQAVDLPEGFRG